MKTNKLWTGIAIIGGLISMNGQNVASTTVLTSGGNTAGTAGSSGTYYGVGAGKVTTNSNNSFFGYNAGIANISGAGNLFAGYAAGAANTSGANNTYLGSSAGQNNQIGNYNVYVGSQSGSTAGNENTSIGMGSGQGTGNNNTYIGKYSGRTTGNGSNNTYVGYYSGIGCTGSNNVFLGNYSGNGAIGSNQLIIESGNYETPLIWGDFASDQLLLNAKVGVGGVTTFPVNVGGVSMANYKLFVQGGILATEVRVATTWADYVFEKSYTLPSLDEVACFIDENGHLPNVPSAKQVAEEGISVGEIVKVQQEKIEELTLYVIGQDKI